MCGSIKAPYPRQGRSLEIPRRGGSQKPKNEALLEIPGGEGGGSNQKGMDMSWNHTIAKTKVMCYL